MNYQILFISSFKSFLYFLGLVLSIIYPNEFIKMIAMIFFSIFTLQAIWRMLKFRSIYRTVNGLDKFYSPFSNREKSLFFIILSIPACTIYYLLINATNYTLFTVLLVFLFTFNYYFGVIANYRFHLYKAYYFNQMENTLEGRL